jgi:Ca-activated chloride channel family protein
MNLFLKTGVALLGVGSLAAAPVIEPDRPPEPGGLLIAAGGFGGVLEIVRHDVRVTINNGIAVTTIDQVFHNTEGRVVEALYTFPVPKNASVASFSMWIGGKEMIGEVVEKQRAREIYESYKSRRVDPGLLEQVDYKAFEMRIFPIAPDAEQRVQVTYYQELDVDADWCTYVYPLATVTRPGLDSRVQGRFSLTVEAKSEVPMVGMNSPSHGDDFVIVSHGEGYREASLEATGGNLDRDVVIAWQLERPRTGLDFVTSREADEDGYLLMTLTAGKELEERDGGMDYVFVSDVSGSMADDGKLVLSQRSSRAFLDSLGERDRFEMISFNVTAETLFNKLTGAAPESLDRAGEFLDDQRARGGTRLRPAIEAAYRYKDADRPLNVVVLSDGMTEAQGHRQLLQVVANRPAGVTVFCIGIGNEVNRPLLRQVAQETGGLAAFLSNGDDFTRQAKAFRRKLMRPAIADVSIEVAGVGLYDVEPRELPNLYHGSPLRLYGRYREAGAAVITLRGTVMGSPISQTFTVELPAVEDANPEIERMWAWNRVQRLLEEERAGDGSRFGVDEIVQLCEGYSIASEYASFLVLENDEEYRRWKIERRNATRIKRDREAQSRLRERLDGMQERAARELGPEVEPEKAKVPEPTAQTPVVRRSPPPTRSQRGVDLDLPRRSRGGGAIDPLTALLALGLAGGAAARRRRRVEQEQDRGEK